MPNRGVSRASATWICASWESGMICHKGEKGRAVPLNLTPSARELLSACERFSFIITIGESPREPTTGTSSLKLGLLIATSAMLVEADVSETQLAAMRGLQHCASFPIEKPAQCKKLISFDTSDDDASQEFPNLSLPTVRSQREPGMAIPWGQGGKLTRADYVPFSVGLGELEQIRSQLEDVVAEGRGSKTAWENARMQPIPFKRDFGNGLVLIAPDPYVPADVDRIARSAIEMTSWLKRMNGDFALEAKHCLIGRDATYRRIPVREELERTWALYVNVLNAPDTIILGRDCDIFHTGVLSTFKGISEYTTGQILAMERWTFGGNNAFMLGIIRGHKTVTSLMTFQHASREDLAKNCGMGDFGSDYLQIHPDTNGLHRFITSITSTEMQILAHYGYVPCADRVYGIVWQPLMDEHWFSMRANALLIDLRLSNEIARISGAIDRVLGSDALVGTFMQFLTPEDISDTCSQVATSLTEHVKAEGIAHGHPNNAFVRSTDLVMEWHLEKLARSGLNADQTLNSLRAMTRAAFFTAQDQFDCIGVDEERRKIVRLALAKQVAEDVQGRKYDSSFTLRTSTRVRDFVDQFQESDLLRLALRYLVGIEEDFRLAVRSRCFRGTQLSGAFNDDEGNGLWEDFGLSIAFKLAGCKSFDFSRGMGNRFVIDFLSKHKYIPFVPVIKGSSDIVTAQSGLPAPSELMPPASTGPAVGTARVFGRVELPVGSAGGLGPAPPNGTPAVGNVVPAGDLTGKDLRSNRTKRKVRAKCV
ncbi:hypothetical protein EDD17DRAFT_1759547 [Pisolithus thermaeus]|nr:hypothetical protein EDD17DRAFT_1759547 [Pisolithus thermaeus]